MGDTKISWTHRPGTRGRTWNPVQGCRRVSRGCEHCYAERLAARFAESGWSQGLINIRTRKWNGEARLAAHKLSEPLRWREPATVFVNSMSDLFYEGFANEQIAAVFGVMAAASHHTYQVLTKRARRMREWSEWLVGRGAYLAHLKSLVPTAGIDKIANALDDVLEAQGLKFVERSAINRAIGDARWPLPNVWIGVSVENQAAADERIPELLRTPAAVRFLSCEPLLGPVDLLHTPRAGEHHDYLTGERMTALVKDSTPRIDWVIAGCESGPGARPCSVEWLRSLRDQCASASVSFFLKQAVEDVGDAEQVCDRNGDEKGCGQRIRYYVHNKHHTSVSCGCTIEGAESANWSPPVGAGDGSRRKPGGVIELPYLDGVQHCSFPEVRHV